MNYIVTFFTNLWLGFVSFIIFWSTLISQHPYSTITIALVVYGFYRLIRYQYRHDNADELEKEKKAEDRERILKERNEALTNQKSAPIDITERWDLVSRECKVSTIEADKLLIDTSDNDESKRFMWIKKNEQTPLEFIGIGEKFYLRQYANRLLIGTELVPVKFDISTLWDYIGIGYYLTVDKITNTAVYVSIRETGTRWSKKQIWIDKGTQFVSVNVDDKYQLKHENSTIIITNYVPEKK